MFNFDQSEPLPSYDQHRAFPLGWGAGLGARSGGGLAVQPQAMADGSSSFLPDTTFSNPADNDLCAVREQDLYMPIANVIRIMRKTLPPHAKIADDAKETVQECVSEFISFVTGEANDRCQREQRKTVTAEDVLWAMSKLGFDDYVPPLTLYLQRHREFEGGSGGASIGKRNAECNHHQHSAGSGYAPGYAPPLAPWFPMDQRPQQLGFFGASAPTNNGFPGKDLSSSGAGSGQVASSRVTAKCEKDD